MLGEESDSGMGSMPDSSKDCTPEKKRNSPTFDEDEEDETLAERLWGLTEMFPEKVRDATHTLFCGTKHGLKSLYSFSRSSMWILFSSSAILLAPLMFEVERAQFEEDRKTQQRQALLGPSTAMAGGPPIR
uniref:Mitochondrial import receptor subunit TOM22 homolog n=1 Tax=Riptortus pedestris TaxID=329032 RepID=R4WKA9_RIPPE|nr:maggie [Riptortus pedestris]